MTLRLVSLSIEPRPGGLRLPEVHLGMSRRLLIFEVAGSRV